MSDPAIPPIHIILVSSVLDDVLQHCFFEKSSIIYRPVGVHRPANPIGVSHAAITAMAVRLGGRCKAGLSVPGSWQWRDRSGLMPQQQKDS